MISYIGGKSLISKRLIIPNIPKDIESYVESFGGMFWNFFKMDLSLYPNLKTVVYNDFNPLNVNLFNCVKHYEEFYENIKKVESQNKDLFYEYQSELFAPDFKVDLSKPDFRVAIAYAYILTQIWSGSIPEKSRFIDLKGKYKSKFDAFKDKLNNENYQEHFDKISFVECMDFEDLMKKYDSKNGFFYQDPPYFLTESYYSNHNFGIETHERLANCLNKLKSKWSLSYYYFPQLSEWFPKDQFTWRSMEFHKASMAKSGKPQTKGTELLIMNY
jgi:DNA adenine methylase